MTARGQLPVPGLGCPGPQAAAGSRPWIGTGSGRGTYNRQDIVGSRSNHGNRNAGPSQCLCRGRAASRRRQTSGPGPPGPVTVAGRRATLATVQVLRPGGGARASRRHSVVHSAAHRVAAARCHCAAGPRCDSWGTGSANLPVNRRGSGWRPWSAAHSQIAGPER